MDFGLLAGQNKQTTESHEGTEKTRDNLRVIAHVSVKFPRCTHTPGAMSTDLINVGLQGKLAFWPLLNHLRTLTLHYDSMISW